MRPYFVKHDGRTIASLPNYSAAFGWLLRYQGQSVHYATTYGGYSIERGEHRFSRADSGRPFLCFCLACGLRMWGGAVEPIGDAVVVWADLNGESFKAYYCDPCKRQREAA